MADPNKIEKKRKSWELAIKTFPDLKNRYGTDPFDTDGNLPRNAQEELKNLLKNMGQQPRAIGPKLPPHLSPRVLGPPEASAVTEGQPPLPVPSQSYWSPGRWRDIATGIGFGLGSLTQKILPTVGIQSRTPPDMFPLYKDPVGKITSYFGPEIKAWEELQKVTAPARGFLYTKDFRNPYFSGGLSDPKAKERYEQKRGAGEDPVTALAAAAEESEAAGDIPFWKQALVGGVTDPIELFPGGLFAKSIPTITRGVGRLIKSGAPEAATKQAVRIGDDVISKIVNRVPDTSVNTTPKGKASAARIVERNFRELMSGQEVTGKKAKISYIAKQTKLSKDEINQIINRGVIEEVIPTARVGKEAAAKQVRIGDDVVFEGVDGTTGAGKVVGEGTIEINEISKPYFTIRTATGETVQSPIEAVRLQAADAPIAPAARAADEAVPGVARDLPAEGLVPPPIKQVSDMADMPIANRFVGALRPLGDIAKEVSTVSNPVIRQVAKLFVNPSAAIDSELGKIAIAYQRQNITIEGHVADALAAGLDTHNVRFLNLGRSLKINSEGILGDTGYHWNDVFSKVDDPRWASKVTDREKAYIKDYLSIIDEAEDLRLTYELSPKSTRNKDGWFYVPRIVEAVKGIPLKRPTNPSLKRVFDEATVGAREGVQYSTNPRENLAIHLQSTYREILEKQLSETVEPFAIKPSALVPANIKKDALDGAIDLRNATRELRRIVVPRAGLRTGKPATPAEKTLRKELDSQRLAAYEAKEKAKEAYKPAREAYINALEKAKKDEIASGYLFGSETEKIPVTLWRNKIVPKDGADILKKVVDGWRAGELESPGFWESLHPKRSFLRLGNTIRFLSATLDFAYPLIHGLPLLTRHPVIWAKSAGIHFAAFFNPNVLSNYIRSNAEIFQEMRMYGVPTAQSDEAFAALQQGQGLSLGKHIEQMPIAGTPARQALELLGKQTFGRFQASYASGLTVSRALLWDSLRGTFKDEPEELAAFIRNLTGGLDTRALGVGPTQRGIESTLLAFSPRLLRSTVALFADAFQAFLPGRTTRQKESLRVLAQYTSGVMGIYVAVGIALDREWEEIQAGLNPLNGKRFLSYKINDDWVGFGGQVRAIIQLLSHLTTLAGSADPGRLWSSDIYENPILGFYLQRGAVGLNIAGTTIEGATGGRINAMPYENIESVPDIFKHLGKSSLAFAVQGQVDGEGSTALIGSALGFRTSPVTPGEKRASLSTKGLQEISEERGLKTYEDYVDYYGWTDGELWSGIDLQGIPKGGYSREPGEVRGYDKDVAYSVGPPIRQELQQTGPYQEQVEKSKERRWDWNPKLAEFTSQIEEIDQKKNESLRAIWDNPLHFRDPVHYKNNRSDVVSAAFIEKRLRYKDNEDILKKFPPVGPIATAEREAKDLLWADDDEDIVNRLLKTPLGKEVLQKYTPIIKDENVNWDESDRRKEYIERAYGKEFLKDIIKEQRLKLIPIEKEYLEDRDYINESRYWDVEKEIAKRLGLSSILEEYNRLDRDNTTRGRNYEDKYSVQINKIKAASREVKLQLRVNNPKLEEVLIKWGDIEKGVMDAMRDKILEGPSHPYQPTRRIRTHQVNW